GPEDRLVILVGDHDLDGPVDPDPAAARRRLDVRRRRVLDRGRPGQAAVDVETRRDLAPGRVVPGDLLAVDPVVEAERGPLGVGRHDRGGPARLRAGEGLVDDDLAPPAAGRDGGRLADLADRVGRDPALSLRVRLLDRVEVVPGRAGDLDR